MTDFTPTTDQVRDAYVRAMRNAFIASAGNAWQTGYAARVADETAGIGADRDDWLDEPIVVERPEKEDDA
jgi:hypothetical protein